jgi:hypothetical protein
VRGLLEEGESSLAGALPPAKNYSSYNKSTPSRARLGVGLLREKFKNTTTSNLTDTNMTHEECVEKSSIWLYLGEKDLFYPLSRFTNEGKVMHILRGGMPLILRARSLILEIAPVMRMLGAHFDPSKGLDRIIYTRIREDSVDVFRGFYEISGQKVSGVTDFVLIVFEEPQCLTTETWKRLARYVQVARDIEALCLPRNSFQ